MIRVIIPLLVVLIAVGVGAWIWAWPVMQASRKERRDSVMAEVRVDTALDNYRLLERSIRAHYKVLDADIMFPTLAAELRTEILGVVNEFERNELPKGS
jgi:hypothetical protein